MMDLEQELISRRGLLRAGGGVAGLALTSRLEGIANAATPRPQNVIVVIIDNVRADYLGAYGNRQIHTPSIDAFARQSLRFTRYRPEVFPTIPVRRSIMTGRRIYPFRNSVLTPGLPQGPGWMAIDPRIPVFTDVLRGAGFHTGYVTDNPHILSAPYDPFRSRFDEPVIVKGQAPYRGTPPGNPSAKLVRSRTLPKLRGTSTEKRVREFLAANSNRKVEADYLAPRVFTAATQWVERASAANQPFALVVDSFDPHEPWDPPEDYLKRYGSGRIGGVKPIQPFAAPGGRSRRFGLRKGAINRVRNLYAAELTLVDAWFGGFIKRVAELGRFEDTLIVLASDHGVLLGERGEVGKRDAMMHKEVTHPPLFIRDPAGRKAGRSSSYFAQSHDIGPTVLSMMGRKAPKGMNGHDLSPLLRGHKPRPRGHQTASYGTYVSATDGRWLLIADNQGKKKRLYDTRRDPYESHNVVEKYPAVARRLWRYVIADAGGKKLPKFG